MLKKLIFLLPVATVLANEPAAEVNAEAEVPTTETKEVTDAELDDMDAPDMPMPSEEDLPSSLDDLLKGDGEGDEGGDPMEKLQKLMEQMKDLGIDMDSLGKKAGPTASEKMTACANLVVKREGQYKSYTLSQLAEIENAHAAGSVKDNNLMQQMVICHEKITDEEYGLYKSRKLKKLSEEQFTAYSVELPSAAQKLLELDPLLFDNAQTVATTFVEAGDRKQSQRAQTTGGVPTVMSLAILCVFFGAIAVLAFITIQMQKNLEKKSDKPVSSKKEKKKNR